MSVHRGRLLPSLSRRELIKLGAGTCAYALCLSACKSAPAVRAKVRVAALEKVPPGLTLYPIERLALKRDARGLAAVSLVCTHQTCLLRDRADGFECPCHGSHFDAHGAAVTGPATEPLPWYQVSIDAQSNIWVDLGAVVDSEWRLSLG